MHADATVVRYRIVYEHVNACVLCARVTTDKLNSDAQTFRILVLASLFYPELNN